MIPISTARKRWASRSLPAKPKAGREEVLRDAYAGTLQPLYNFMADLPGIEGAPIPLITATRASRTVGGLTSFDAGRGRPFQCSFCTIINVQGRKSRRRSPDDVEQIIRENVAQGLHSFFITDDNFARNQDWEPILDRLIRLRKVEKMNLSFVIQVDTLCHKLPKFIKKCKSAGVKARLHRAREYQSRQPGRREETAEQDHRVSQDAARLEGGPRHHLRRLHHRFP